MFPSNAPCSTRRALKAARASAKAAEEEAKRLLLLQQVQHNTALASASPDTRCLQRALDEQRRLEQLAAEKRNAEAQAEAAAAAAAAQKAAAAAASAERCAAKEAEKELALSTQQTAVSKKGGFDQQQVGETVDAAAAVCFYDPGSGLHQLVPHAAASQTRWRPLVSSAAYLPRLAPASFASFDVTR